MVATKPAATAHTAILGEVVVVVVVVARCCMQLLLVKKIALVTIQNKLTDAATVCNWQRSCLAEVVVTREKSFKECVARCILLGTFVNVVE